MTTLKFTNVKYYRGGSKVPKRLRFNQNYNINIYLKSQMYLLNLSNEELVNGLIHITNGKVTPSSTTKVKRIQS